MKQIILPVFVLLSVGSIMAQNVALDENFNNGILPTGWVAYDSLSDGYKWEIAHHFEGGFTFNGTSFALVTTTTAPTTTFLNERLTSPNVDISNYSNAILEFDQYFWYWGGEKANLEVWNGSTWVTILQQTTSVGETFSRYNTKKIDVTAYKNAAFKVRFSYLNAKNSRFWAIDNVKIYEPAPNDVGISSIDNITNGTPSTISPKIYVKNFGKTAQTFDVKLKIGTYSNTQTVSSLAAGGGQLVTFQNWSSTVGKHQVEVYTTLANDAYRRNDTIRKNINILNLTNKSYGYITYTSDSNFYKGPVVFSLDEPSKIIQLAIDGERTIEGGTMANGVWYTTGWVNFDRHLIKIDTATGKRTVIGAHAANFVITMALTWDPITATLFGFSDRGDLFSFNTTTGKSTLIGASNWLSSQPYGFVNLACNPINGNLYSINVGYDTLYRINKTTGIITAVGHVGRDLRYGQDMEFTSNGALILTGFTGTNTSFLGRADASTGAIQTLGMFGNNKSIYEITGLAIPASSTALVDTKEQYISDVAISNFPNPAHEWMVIDAAEEMKQIRIFNSVGQLIFESTPRDNHSVLKTVLMPTGTYLMQVITDKGMATRKIMIQH